MGAGHYSSALAFLGCCRVRTVFAVPRELHPHTRANVFGIANSVTTANNGSPATSPAKETHSSASIEAVLLPFASHTESGSAEKSSNAAASAMIKVIGLIERLTVLAR